MCNGGGKIATALGGLREIAGEDRPVPTHLARDVESWRLRFAMVTVRSDDNRSRIVGIRMEPGNCQVAALMSSFPLAYSAHSRTSGTSAALALRQKQSLVFRRRDELAGTGPRCSSY